MGQCELVGSGVLIRLHFHTMLTRLQPGHWLVLITTLEFVNQLAMFFGYWLLQRSQHAGGDGTRALSILQGGAVLMGSLIAAVCLLAFFKLRDTRRWNIFIGVKALAAVMSVAASVLFLVTILFQSSQYSLGSFFTWITWINVCMTIGPVAVFIMFVVVVALDLWRRATRDWLHWLGVGVVGSTYVLSLAMLVFSLFRK